MLSLAIVVLALCLLAAKELIQVNGSKQAKNVASKLLFAIIPLTVTAFILIGCRVLG